MLRIQRVRSHLATVALLVAPLLVVACGGSGNSNTNPAPPALVSIAITPGSASISKGLTQQFSAKGTYSDNSTADLTSSASWSSGATAVASIDPHSGLATAVATGSASITATSGTVSASAAVSVTAAVVESINISPNPAYAGIGVNRQLAAIATYSDGTTGDVSSSAAWVSSATSVANVGPTTGLVTASALGSATITASIGSITSSGPLSVVSKVWTPTGQPNIFHAANPAVVLPNGNVLVAGTSNCNANAPMSSELYDYVSGTWTLTGSMVRLSCPQSLTLLNNGTVLAIGPDTTSSVGALVAEIYDPASGTWSTTGSPIEAQLGAPATLLQNGNVLLAAGLSNGSRTGDMEIYDSTAGTWAVTGSMSVARTEHTATLLADGRVLLSGGVANTGITNTAEIYDPSTGLSSPTGSMSESRSSHTSTLLQSGLVFVAGGIDSGVVGGVGSPGSEFALSGTEIYDPVAGTWSSTENMTTSRIAHTATLMPDGQVLLTGGFEYESYSQGYFYTTGPQSSAELFNPATGLSTATGSMADARATHDALLLPNGSVLVVGEALNYTLYYTAELYWY